MSASRWFSSNLRCAVRSRGIESHGECDCGAPTRMGFGVCDRCAWLDGVGRGRGSMISALRDQRFASIHELAATLDVTERDVLRTLALLRRDGRVQAQIIDAVHDANGKRRGADHAVYFLVDRRSA